MIWLLERVLMKISILTIGSRGDVQPYVALGVGLEGAGHEVTVATSRGFGAFVEGHGLNVHGLDVDELDELARTAEGKAALSGRRLPGTLRRIMRMFRRMLDGEWEACRGADAVVYHPKAIGGYHVAEALGVPGFLAHPVPMFSPTSAFPTPVLPFANLGGFLNRASYGMFLRAIGAPYQRVVNRWRQETLGLPPRRFLAGELESRGRPVPRLVCCSPSVVSAPADWEDSTVMTGYWFLGRDDGWRPPEDLAAFLDAGPPPVYVGFGSLAAWSSPGVFEAATAALRDLGLRGVLATGDTAVPTDVPDGVFAIGSAPHDWLFPRMTAVVHHGGAGTTAEGLRAGRPTVVCPSSLNDQAFWGRRVSGLGVGPDPIPQRKLTAGGLTRAIRLAVNDRGMRRRADALGERIRAEDGVARAIQSIEGRLSAADAPVGA